MGKRPPEMIVNRSGYYYIGQAIRKGSLERRDVQPGGIDTSRAWPALQIQNLPGNAIRRSVVDERLKLHHGVERVRETLVLETNFR
jgi:hypothetical protein